LSVSAGSSEKKNKQQRRRKRNWGITRGKALTFKELRSTAASASREKEKKELSRGGKG